MNRNWRDNGLRYGRVTRIFHWTMAALLVWQFTGMAVKEIVGRAPITAFWVGTHVSVGALLWLLLILRAIWGLYNLPHRPRHRDGLLGFAAVGGHLLLYGLMLVVPSLALLRAAGSGKGLTVFGLPLIEAGGAKVDWMTAPANAAHGTLAWLLLRVVAGHLVMVAIHHLAWKDDTLARMLR